MNDAESAAPDMPTAEAGAAGSGRGAMLEPFVTCTDPDRRRLNAAMQLGVISFALWIVSLYFDWGAGSGRAVDDPPNLWFNCIPLGAFALTLHCISRARHRTAGAVALMGLTAGLLYIIFENAFGMFTYRDGGAGAGFWLGIASYIIMLAAAGYAGRLVGNECCRGRRADGRPRSPWLVLGMLVASIGWIVVRFLPDFIITVHRTPGDGANGLAGAAETEVFERGLVANLDGLQFIPELAGWAIFLLAAPMAAWVLRRQLAAAFIGGFVVFFASDLATNLAVDYSLDYSSDTESGMNLAVDYGLGPGSLALAATFGVFVLALLAIYLTGSEHPAEES